MPHHSDPSPPRPAGTGRVRHAVRRVALDTSPFRSRDFRLLWIGQTVSMMGSAVATVALPFQVYEITRSPLAVGMLGATELVPLLVLSIVGGSIADASDRRKLMLAILAVQAAASALLAWHATIHSRLWVLYVMSGVQAGLWGLSIPTRRSWSPRLVPPDKLASAAALESTSMTFTHLAGPAIGGIALAVVGLWKTYGLDAASFVFAIGMVALMKPSPPSEHAPAAGFRSILEGLRFLKGRKVLQGGFWIDLNAMIFGMPKALFPAVALTMAHGNVKESASILGFLYSAPWAGAFVATSTSGWVTRMRRQGLGVFVSVLGWGAAIAVFGFMRSMPLAFAMLALAGFADAISAVLRTAIVQEVTPDHLRGRLSGMEIAVYAGGPTIGDMESGVVAGLTSVRTSIVSGGVACLAGAFIVAAALPQLIRYDRTRDLQPSPAEKTLDSV